MKILIGCPTYERYDYCVDRWVNAVRNIQEFSKEYEVDYLLVDNSESEHFFNVLRVKGFNVVRTPYFPESKDRIVYSRNFLREKVLNEGYDYFLSLEQDLIPEMDVLERLMSHNKKIVSAYYGRPVGVTLVDKESGEKKDAVIEVALVWLRAENGLKRANPHEVLGKGLISVGAFGVGCVLIHMDVLEKVRFRCVPEKRTFDDMFFCIDAKSLGYVLYLDSDIRVLHLHKVWTKEDT